MIKLDRHIEILLLTHDCVIVPDFGGFMTHYVKARYDDRDNMFLPPSRTLGFNQQLKLNDSLLAQSYVEAYDLSYPEAVTCIADEVEELKQHLKNEGMYELNDLGILYNSSDDVYTFEPCESGILTPDLYGLNTLEVNVLSMLSENTITDKESISWKKASQMTSGYNKPKRLEYSTAEKGNDVVIPKQYVSKTEHIAVSVNVVRNIAVACIAALIFFLFPLNLGMNDTGKIAGNIVNTAMLTQIMPKDVTSRHQTAIRLASSNPVSVAKSNSVSRKRSETTQTTMEEQKVDTSYYTLVLASRISKSNAEEFVNEIRKKDYKLAEILYKGKGIKVVYGKYQTMNEAYNALNRLHKNEIFTDSWVLEVK